MSNLDILYETLDFKSGALYPVTDSPLLCPVEIDWIEKGEWLSAAKRAGAERIFFVENNPVIVFARCGPGLEEKVKAFNRAWCLARPRLLFLASPGEITVYDLARQPVDEDKQEEWKKLDSLKKVDSPKILQDISRVSRELQQYHRDRVESGRLFADQRFGDLSRRADRSLITDLKTVRRELIRAGFSGDKTRFAHALIGRSIFIRYLEDRGILTEAYFMGLARDKAGWNGLLRNPVNREGLDFSRHKTFYPRVLADKEFTYALFRKLARDFNGDMFPDIDEEETFVNPDHLELIQDLFYGDVGIQKKLFFYSYRFDIIPLDLISSIYEEFYHTSASEEENTDKKRKTGAFYTPPVLVEFVLSRLLTPPVLEKSPRILDPACGSGIFLVEAFRRIVRYEWYKSKQPLTFEKLRNILKNQIAGIELNEEAARITAFSLYLSLLHYLDPPAIDQRIKRGNKLPNLVVSRCRSDNHFHCILPGNAFDAPLIESDPYLQERFGEACADIVIGNPPWGSPGPKADSETKRHHEKLIDWCASKKNPIGDEEPSQAFLWRALYSLKEKGNAGMLVSTGVLFKHNTTSLDFRQSWLSRVKLSEVFNFSHARNFFFKGTIAPFLFISFSKENQGDNPVYYWSAKQAANIKKTQAIVFSRYDLNVLHAGDLTETSIWKELWFGRPADREFLRLLRRYPRIGQLCNRMDSGQGFTEAFKDRDAKPLQIFKCLDAKSFSRYDPLSFSTAPQKVKRMGILSVYNGYRLLVQRGIRQNDDTKGTIAARYETEPFCFSNAVNGLKLQSPEEWKYKTILGILWSSLARYFFFMTSSNWGLWHYEIHLDDELLQLPVILDRSNPATDKIIASVDRLRDYHPPKKNLYHPDGVPEEHIAARRSQLEAELDEAVFELFALNQEEKDLIHDLCTVTLPFFYEPFDSAGTMPVIERDEYSRIEEYIHTFCPRWNVFLGEDEEMRAEVHVAANDTLVAVEFFPADKEDPWEIKSKTDRWDYILQQIGETLAQPMGTSQIILEGLVHVISDRGIIIVKRNERRFWTKSLAREDADTAISKRMMGAFPKLDKQK